MQIDNILEKYLDTLALAIPQNLCNAMRYGVLNGGKRFRPLLVYTVGKMYQASQEALEAPACAIELIHSFSLIHDDLPAMDNDDLRRGKPTCHKAFDEATAILAGDALMAYAFQIISESSLLSPKQIVEMIKVLSRSCGPEGLAGGQDLDIQFTTNSLKFAEISPEQVEHMYALKTGALLSAAVKLGAIAANIYDSKELNLLDIFAKNIGIAFQIQDDILNIESNANILGKNTGTDKKLNKHTYPALLGLDKAKERVNILWQEAESALDQLSVDANKLLNLSNAIKERNH